MIGIELDINGEKIGVAEATNLIRMLDHDAKEIAGVFYDMDRSPKFRVNWPDQDRFVAANWKTFIAAARAMYAERLGDPKTPPHEARMMSLALILGHKLEKSMALLGVAPDDRLQLKPNTQQFVGDKYENKKIVEKFGMKPNLRAALLNSAATRH